MWIRQSNYDKTSDHNKKIISDYLEERKLNGKRPNTISREKQFLSEFARRVNKDLQSVNKNDVINFFKKTNLKLSSQQPFKSTLRQFYKWLNQIEDNNNLPACVSWLKIMSRDKVKKELNIDNSAKLISNEEYQKMSNESYSIQSKALLQTLHLSGARVSELLSVNIDDVKITDDCVQIYVRESKTIPRWIPLSEYPDHLIKWLEEHPHKNHKDKPLWINQINDKRYYLKRMGAHNLRYRLKQIAKNAGLHRNITPHMFRHTRATIDFGNGLPAPLMRIKFGWSDTSNMLKEYDHNAYNNLLEWTVKNCVIKNPQYQPRIENEQKLVEKPDKNEVELLQREVYQMKQEMALMHKAFDSDFFQMRSQDNHSEITHTTQIETLDGEIQFVDLTIPAPNLSVNDMVLEYKTFSNNVAQIKKDLLTKGDYSSLQQYGEMVDKLL